MDTELVAIFVGGFILGFVVAYILRSKKSGATKTIRITYQVQLGRGASDFDRLRNRLINRDVHLGSGITCDVLKSIKFPSQNWTIPLEVFNARDFGFYQNAPILQVMAEAIKKGYSLCPVEAAAQILLQYREFPWWDGAIMAVEKSPGEYVTMTFKREREAAWLCADRITTETNLHPGTLFVLMPSS